MCKCVCTFYIDSNNVIIDIENFYSLKTIDKEVVGKDFFKVFNFEIPSKALSFLRSNNINSYVIHQNFSLLQIHLNGFFLVKNNTGGLFTEILFYQHDTEYLDLLPRNKKYLYLNCQSIYSLSNLTEVVPQQEKTDGILSQFLNAINDESISVEKSTCKAAKKLLLKTEKISFYLNNNTGAVYELECCSIQTKNKNKIHTAISYAKLNSGKQRIELSAPLSNNTATTSSEILENSSTYIYIYDLIDKKIVYSNFKTRKYLGFVEEEWNTFDLEASTNPKIQALKDKVLTLKDGEKVDDDVNYFSAAESKTYWLNVCKKVYKRNAEGTPIQIINFTNDITEEVGQRKFYKTAYEYKNALINAIPEIVLVVNTEGFYLNVFSGSNDTSYKPNLDIVGKHVTEVLPEKQAKIALDKLRYSIKNQTTVQYYLDRELNGKTYKLNNSCSPIDTEKAIIIVKNETEYFATKEALEKSNNELIDKNKKLEEYLEKNNKLERFAYVLSHDFKEPMRSISGFSELLQRKHAGKFDDESMQYLKFINEGIDKMNQMLDGIIAYSQLDEEKFSYEEIDLTQVLDHVKLKLNNIIEEKQVEFAVSALPVAKCNKKQIITVFENLIANSIQNTTKQPKISIESSLLENKHLIEISDNGIGIDESKNIEVFKMFKKLGNTNKSGMGLALCKKIVENHGGEIWVAKNENNTGTKIKFTIPV